MKDEYEWPLARRLLSKQRMRRIIANHLKTRVKPAFFASGIWVHTCNAGQALLDLFIAMLSFVFCVFWYCIYLAGFLTWPVSVSLMYRFYRRRAYRRSLGERAYKQKQRREQSSNNIWG